ncbi:MAG: RNA pseudouridine synthase [Kaiparowitsia implicata GSE-PSE-MK54-09C]|jgi:23S rRNA pseudouridine1911/1915/1917 synthase|nr:RNA pseudouridine synthase [Kaiparowitsia implicata GSE-PSE-MK54-09C]
MNDGWIYQDQVLPRDVGQTLVNYYAQRYRHSSQADWQQRIESGQIWVDGAIAPPETLLKPGQRLAYRRPPWQEPPVPLTFEVLYDDGDVIAIAKPAGLPMLPGGGFVQHTLLWQVQQRYPAEDSDHRPYPVHRLGRGTSGLTLWGRSPAARAYLTQQFRRNTAQPVSSPAEQSAAAPLRKTYRALVGAWQLPDTFTLTQPIGKLPHPTLGYVYGATATGRPAHSEGRVLWRKGKDDIAPGGTTDCTLLEVTILTGRPHQIRIHLAAAGYPLLGDPLYLPGGIPRQPADSATRDTASQAAAPCSESPPESPGVLPMPGDCGYWLHAHRLWFCHPIGTPMMLEASPPLLLREEWE